MVSDKFCPPLVPLEDFQVFCGAHGLSRARNLNFLTTSSLLAGKLNNLDIVKLFVLLNYSKL